IPAKKEEEQILANLLELYAYDLSELFDLKIGADGRFGYEPLHLYWHDSKHFPFLIRVNGDLAGFVLLQKGSQITGAIDTWDVAEFFVLRPYRKRGVGVAVAQTVWKIFPGRWEVRVLEKNLAAQSFWQNAISKFLGSHSEPALMEVAGKKWYVFAFDSK